MGNEEREVRKKMEVDHLQVVMSEQKKVSHMGGKQTAEKVRKGDERMKEVIKREEPTSTPPRSRSLCGNQKTISYGIVVYTM